jgi:hypothetical protein
MLSHVQIHPHSFLLQAVPLLFFVSKCNVGYSLMFIYIHIISYYKLFLYFTLCLSVMLDTLSCSYTPYPFLLQAVPLLYFVSNCNVGYSLMFIYIHILSYYKLFLYFTLCLSVMLDTLSSSFTSISFLTTSCSFTLVYVFV